MKKNKLGKIEKAVMKNVLSHLQNGFSYNRKTKMVQAKFIFEMDPVLFEMFKSAYEKFMQTK